MTEQTSVSKQSHKRPLGSAEKLSPLDKKSRLPINTNNAVRNLHKEINMTTNEDIMEVLTSMRADLSKLPKMQKDISEINDSLREITQSLEFTQEQLADACEEISTLKARCDEFDDVKMQLQSLKLRNTELEQRITAQEVYSRRENLVVHGIRPREGNFENCFETAHSLFDMLGLPDFPLQRVHRLNNSRYRDDKFVPPLIIRFVCFQDKLAVLRNRSHLRGTRVFLKDDIPIEDEIKLDILRPTVKHLKSQDRTTTIVHGDQIRFRNKNYSVKNIANIPADLTKLGSKENDNVFAFSGETNPLSNLFHCNITVEGTVYPSAEHYYQSEKCKSLGKADIAEKVLNAELSRGAMLLGKSVNPPNEWYGEKGANIMKKVIAAKVNQVAKCKELLIAKRGKSFAEATRHRIWGTGVPIYSNETLNKDKWSGKNLLGSIYDDILKSIPP